MSLIVTPAELKQLRDTAEAMMWDTCTITRAGSRGDLDEGSLAYAPTTAATVYAGKCKVQRENVSIATETEAVGRDWPTQPLRVDLPIDGTDTVAVNDIVTLTVSTNDPALQGRQFTVVALPHKTFATARRLRCIEGV